MDKQMSWQTRAEQYAIIVILRRRTVTYVL